MINKMKVDREKYSLTKGLYTQDSSITEDLIFNNMDEGELVSNL